MKTFAAVRGHTFQRGDYLDVFGERASIMRYRIVAATSTTATVRAQHPRRLVEWIHARYEDARWLVADRWPRVTVR
jgi:hypothetical protein